MTTPASFDALDKWKDGFIENAGPDDPKSFPFVLHVALDRFNQVGNQVVSSLQLDLDLREGVLKTVLQSDERVVNADQGHDQEQEENADDDKNDDGGHDG